MADRLKFPLSLPVGQLQLGDCVQCYDGAYGTGHVVEISSTGVVVFRPYIMVSDFSYSEPLKVIPYVGHEYVTYPIASSRPMLVYSRKEIK